ncbi:RING finger protein 112 isoform X15 [Pipistrellus kuhlii]|uniref:RING finger protein 112 isoform X15 n=1 Tax=Pipistrellus kuhlii TaxID=59472 RepID=UPI001E26FADB|nr:RING finger protein 112 isoform X15 [Pipistrellus kuhlii]
MEQAPSPFCPYLFRLHGDSPLPAACIPASARDSEPGRSLPPLGLFPHPASSPASPETAPLSTDLTSSSQLWLGSSTTPSALRLPRAAHPSLRGLTVSGPLPSASGPAPRPAAHAQARLLTHFLLSPVWQTGEKAEPHGKQRQQLVPHAAPQAGAGPGVRARGAPGAARLHPLLGEAPAGPVPPAPQGSAEGPAGPGGEDGAPAAEAAARPAGARRGAGAAAAGARGRGGRPAAQDGRREPRPEAPAGPRHARLPARRAGRAAPREGPAPPQPAAGAARPGGRREAEGWPSGEGALPGCRWGADSPDRGVRMWSQPFLLGKEGQQVREAGGPGGEGRGEEEGRQAALSLTLAQVAVFLVDTGDAMSPELSPETRTKLCALIMMLSSYQILHTSRELEDTDLECLEMFVHVAEVMGRHYGMVPIQVRPALDSSRSPGPARRLLASGALLFQRLDLLVRDSPHPSPAGRGPVGDALPRSGKYPRVRELLRGRQARRCLLPAPRPPRAGRGRGSPGGPEDAACPLRAYVAEVLSAAPQLAKSRSQGSGSEGRPAARGDGRLLTGQQLAQEIKMAAQLQDLRTVEAAKQEFKEFVRQQDAATKRIFSALRVLPDTMRSLLSAQKDAVLARHAAALRSPGRARALEALEAELQAQARAFMDAYTVRFCGHLAAVGGALGAGLMGLAGGVVAAGAAVGATGAAVVGGGVGAGLAAALGCLEGEEEERLQAGDREPLLGAE